MSLLSGATVVKAVRLSPVWALECCTAVAPGGPGFLPPALPLGKRASSAADQVLSRWLFPALGSGSRGLSCHELVEVAVGAAAVLSELWPPSFLIGGVGPSCLQRPRHQMRALSLPCHSASESEGVLGEWPLERLFSLFASCCCG